MISTIDNNQPVNTTINDIINGIVCAMDYVVSNAIRVVDGASAKDLKDIANSNVLYLFGTDSNILIYNQYGALLVVDVDKVPVDNIKGLAGDYFINTIDDILDIGTIANIGNIGNV